MLGMPRAKRKRGFDGVLCTEVRKRGFCGVFWGMQEGGVNVQCPGSEGANAQCPRKEVGARAWSTPARKGDRAVVSRVGAPRQYLCWFVLLVFPGVSALGTATKF